MKIGIDARFYRKSTAGLGRYTQSLLKHLSQIDKENEYIVFITKEDDLEYDIKAKNFKKVIVPITHYTLAEQTKFLHILNTYNLDLVHFLNFNHPILYNKPFIVTIHDLTMLLFTVGRSQKSLLRKFAFKTVMKNAVQKSKYVIAISKATKKDIIEHFHTNKDKIKVIYEGYNQIYTKNYSQKEIEKIKNKYNIKKPFLLFVSQWRPHKGLPNLIRAFEKIKTNYKLDIQLAITGKPNKDFPQIIQSIKSSTFKKDIITPGFVDETDLPILYKTCLAFIFPSFYEGFGLGPLEAMASGASVISSDLSCMPEILGDAPIYFNPKNIGKMTNIIYQTVTDKNLLEKMKQKSLLQAKKYSWQKMAKETLDLYEKI